MKKHDVNLALATAMEPKPESDSVYVDGHYYSPLGCWESHNCEMVDIGEWVRTNWQPVDFFESESASALLLESMPDPILFKYNDGWACCHICTMNDWYKQSAKHPKRMYAIALAKAKELGLDVGTIEEDK